MEQSLVLAEPIERSIKILIELVENIAMREESSILFVVIHNDVVLGESTPLTIYPDSKETPRIYDINFVVELSFIINDRSSMDAIISTPVLIKMMRNNQNQHSPNSAGSAVESRRKAKLATQNQTSASSNVIGFCNLDLMPILLGKKSFVEKLIVETAHLSFDADVVPWQNLPVVTTKVIYDGDEIFPSGTKINFLSITVESIYNPLFFFTENEDYKAATIIYIDDELPENLIFEDGKWVKYRDVERTKRWRSLSKLQSRVRLSKNKLSRDYTDIRNMLAAKLDLEKKVWQDEPRIEWNFMNRSVMYDVGAQSMQRHIVKRKYWPFQFMVIEKNVGKDNAKLKENRRAKYQLYQCYVDLSELLYPGRKSTRVVAQLYTYDPSSMAEKTGLEKDIFNIDSWGKDLEGREKETRKNKSFQSDSEIISSIPLISETGESVFVIIEFELHYPLIPCKLESDFSDIIDEMMAPKIIEPHYVYSGNMVEEQYATCIRKLVQIITENYRDFREERTREKLTASKRQENEKAEKTNYCFVPEEDELTCFTQYLYKTGTYLAIRSTLKEKVITLLDQKFKIDVSTVDSVDSQNFIASAYTYLVERMHMAINKIVESRLVDDLPKIASAVKLYFYAEELYELGHIDDARRHYQTAIAANKNDAEAWTKYAIFHLKIDDAERAKECCRDAILSDKRDKVALLMYGLILAEDQDYREAEVFLRILTEFYPRFAEGWLTLHLFYMRTNYCPGIDVTLRIAERCMRDENQEIETPDEDPIAWTTIHCPRDSVYMITAVLLMKLHLRDFAGAALAEEMSRAGRSTHVLYYLAVLHYLSHRYEDALAHLREAECDYGMDYSISSLMGHCYFQEGNFEEAIRCYEFANMVFNKPDDLHLVQTRMGLYYENVGDYESALKVFLSASRTSPTAETWLGAGVAFYELQRFMEAEAALSEANCIDNRNADVWKYLCLLNVSLQRHDEFEQCYRQLVQDNAAFSLEKRSLEPRGKPSGSVAL